MPNHQGRKYSTPLTGPPKYRWLSLLITGNQHYLCWYVQPKEIKAMNDTYQTGDNAVDEVILLMYCRVMDLPIDEQVTKEITTESLILYNSLCASMDKDSMQDTIMNWSVCMKRDLLEFEEWYQGLHM